MATSVINSAKRTFANAGLYLGAIAAGVAMSKAMRAGKTSSENLKRIRAMTKAD